MKGKWLAACIAAIVGLNVAGGFSVGQANASDLAADKTYEMLVQAYHGLDKENVRIQEWKPLPLSVQPIPEHQQQAELAWIEKEMETLQAQKPKHEAVMAQSQQALEAVRTDLANGKLTQADASMLQQMFQDSVDKSHKSLEEIDRQGAVLSAQKQEILNYKEPDQIQYALVEFDYWLKTYSKTVFYNVTEQRLLSDDEIQKHPLASKYNAIMAPVLSAKVLNSILWIGAVCCLTAFISVLAARPRKYGTKFNLPRMESGIEL